MLNESTSDAAMAKLKMEMEWEMLPEKARRANAKRSVNRHIKRATRAILEAQGTVGFMCPKCHTRHPTPEARAACKRSHV